MTSMARLNEEGPLDSNVNASDHILSPQPCARPSKDHLRSLETSHLLNENGTTINDDQVFAQDYEHSSSSPSERHSTSDVFGREIDDELAQLKSRASSRSSLSSIPASVLVHPLDKSKQAPALNVDDQLAGYNLEDDEATFGNFDGPPKSLRTIRQREAAFRKPSSVRAMQMHTEDEADDDEYLTPPRRRGGMRSPGSSPLKRSPYYSPNASANKPTKVKKEFPLVLLHCNLLAPSLPVLGAAEPQNQRVVEEVLPSIYWKRWRKLQDKVGAGVLRDRGVLISHPEDLYDVLEERLLESLELQRPRLGQGHFLGREDSGDGSEGEASDRWASETDGEQGEECPDCGVRVLRHGDGNRKWEIKVFAANGLMRAGAWAAAWKEMEKVDVEVGVWLPSDVRRALEKRLAEESAANALLRSSSAVDYKAMFEADSRRHSVRTHSRMVSDAGSLPASKPPASPAPAAVEPGGPQTGHGKQSDVALQTLVINYIRVLASDKRNVALVIMSALVVFLAIGSRPSNLPLLPAMHPFSVDVTDSSPVSSIDIAASPSAFVIPSSGLSEGVSTRSVAVPSFPTASTISTSTANILSPSSTVESETHLRTPEAADQSDPGATEIEYLTAQARDEIEQRAIDEVDTSSG